MKQAKFSCRIVVIAGTAPDNEKPSYREPAKLRPTGRRIIVIKNGKLVGRRRGH